ncbi:hypothetical protein KCP75_11770 [Salmonella enterica subsp. enterica]|nr:hypothetical protein KCP75_11770 [Salmonella enterica subsp. enterica]
MTTARTAQSVRSVVAPVRQSNLCLEIALPTKPLNDVNDENGEARCVRCLHSTRKPLKLWTSWKNCILASTLWMSCSIIRITRFRLPNARHQWAGSRTALGIGVIACYWLAKNGKHSDGSANNLTHKTFEAIQYYLLKASNELAKSRRLPMVQQTTYAKGILPIGT